MQYFRFLSVLLENRLLAKFYRKVDAVELQDTKFSMFLLFVCLFCFKALVNVKTQI